MVSAFRWQIEGKLAGMGFPFEWNDEFLREKNIGAIVTLTENPITYPAWIEGDNSFNILHLPTTDNGFGPSIKDSEKAIQFIDDILATGSAVTVHCQAGKSRTGHLLGYYLVYHGMDPEKVFEELHRFPMLSDDITSQMRYNIRFYKKYLDSLKN
ncbi:MAG: dual specificity protein phosphatase family protein [Nanoarchaeota archaeon]|nr:dual specificity protein phosphatase family protein [Nanoarchaeota archaeon]